MGFKYQAYIDPPMCKEREQIRAFLDICKLSQYYETFTHEGFDRIATLLDITESDLASMNVKRGHRRLLQRAIATARGIPNSDPINIDYETYNNTRKRKPWAASKPFTSFDTFLSQGSLAEEVLDGASERWSQLSDSEKQYYEIQASLANDNPNTYPSPPPPPTL
ncbi:hypothetical protein BY458DRAFT_513395 [Sporodiniella umbellata]|nr:hypothetical protein BY458DRAFT_513395 [Sporodiniella umbellata]